MEQKKILWIIVAVCACLLLIFVVALVLYAPSRSTGPTLRQAAAVTPAARTVPGTDPSAPMPSLDPDSWVREPGKTPGLDATVQPGPGSINITNVIGDNTGANYGTLDVTGLTKGPAPAAPDAQTPPLPGQASPAPSVSAGAAPASVTASATATGSTATATATATTAQTKPATAQTTVKAASAKAALVKTATTKKTSVTEYWIQTGSFSSKLNAEKARDALAARYLDAEIFTKEVSGATAYRVRVGPG